MIRTLWSTQLQERLRLPCLWTGQGVGRGAQALGLRLRNRWLFAFDILVLPVVIFASYAFRLGTPDLGPFWSSYGQFVFICVALAPMMFIRAGLYSRFWPYATAEDFANLILVTVTLVVISRLAVLIVGASLELAGASAVKPPPVGAFVLTLFGTVASVCAPRFALSLAGMTSFNRQTANSQEPVVILGAGHAGVMIAREIRRNQHLNLKVAAFVDDDPTKMGTVIHGIKVEGRCQDLADVALHTHASKAIIAMPSAPGSTIREIADICKSANVEAQIVPGLYDLIGGQVRIEQLRHVEIEDLLRREPIHTDLAAVEATITGKSVLVTGAGGSIGSELCRQILRFHPREIILLGHGENSIFSIQRELLRLVHEANNASLSPTEIVPVIADIRFVERVDAVFESYRPDVVFHAGAHKHVPLMEQHPTEAILTNVCGTENVLAASKRVGVERFVYISTDKAVNPTSVMGASKRAAELLVLQAAKDVVRPYVVVRFGNVLGSRGSVVLTMKDQIARGGPVTVTHPEMVRFFMTIPEAVQLVLQASVIGTGGEVFTFDMGEPVRILDLARDLIRLSGLTEDEDIDIEFIGPRPGEKLYEELFLESEDYSRTSHEKIFISKPTPKMQTSDFHTKLDQLKQVAHGRDDAAVRSHLQALVPKYQPGSITATHGMWCHQPGQERSSVSGDHQPARVAPAFEIAIETGTK